ncbi:hypothetical protein [Rhodococcus kronopolitis]|uniref:SWIM-type domain-containing protein n=1 Tax=Rhodococcus kronopolitis TaxID=1460226 RepID=A0ABV9FYS0_9NOCA
MSAEFGVTAWGRAWLRTVESTTVSAPNPALPQARSLARNGAVHLATVGAGRVLAEVTVRGKVFPVTVQVPVWTRKDAGTVRRLLGRAGAQDRRVSAGELPDGLVAELLAKDIAVAPVIAECTATCGCTGRRSPCVHHLAVLYGLVRRVDEEPAVAVALRENGARSTTVAANPESDWLALTEIAADGFYGD